MGINSKEKIKKREKITVASLPDESFRYAVVIVLREELRRSEETEFLLDWIEDMWAAIDTLVQRFGEKDARKIILARSALPRMPDGYRKC
jgi:hypothetical protein